MERLRLGDAARPEGVPDLVDFRAKFACQHPAPPITSSEIAVGGTCSQRRRCPTPNEKGGAGAPPLSGADWLLVNRQTTISEGESVAVQRSRSSGNSESDLVIALETGNMVTRHDRYHSSIDTMMARKLFAAF
jgi:hypothetical protein